MPDPGGASPQFSRISRFNSLRSPTDNSSHVSACTGDLPRAEQDCSRDRRTKRSGAVMRRTARDRGESWDPQLEPPRESSRPPTRSGEWNNPDTSCCTATSKALSIRSARRSRVSCVGNTLYDLDSVRTWFHVLRGLRETLECFRLGLDLNNRNPDRLASRFSNSFLHFFTRNLRDQDSVALCGT